MANTQTAQIVSLLGWREKKAGDLLTAPSIECPTCEKITGPIKVAADGATTYRCIGSGHRSLTWRIDANGDMLRGAAGRRYF